MLRIFLAVLLVVLIVGCTNEVRSRAHPDAGTSSGITGGTLGESCSSSKATGLHAAGKNALFALLADGALIEVSNKSGRVENKVSLGPSPRQLGAGSYLALGKSGKTLFALMPGTRDRPSRVAEVDAASFRVRCRYALPKGIIFRSLAIGPKTGHLYLFGNQPGKKVRGSVGTYPEESVVVAVLDPKSGKILRNQKIREARGKDWSVYQGAVSPDERELFVSYHGSDTTGIDSIKVTPKGLDRCQAHSPDGQGCIAAHSGVETYGKRLLIHNSDSPWMEEITRKGGVIKKWNTHLEGNHMLHFAVDARTERLYAVGSCGYTGGLSRVSFDTSWVKVLDPTLHYSPSGHIARSALRRAVCGERIALGPGSLLAVAKTAGSVTQPGASGALLLVNGDTGRKVRTVKTSSEPVDLIFAPLP